MDDFFEADYLPWPAMLHKFDESEKNRLLLNWKMVEPSSV